MRFFIIYIFSTIFFIFTMNSIYNIQKHLPLYDKKHKNISFENKENNNILILGSSPTYAALNLDFLNNNLLEKTEFISLARRFHEIKEVEELYLNIMNSDTKKVFISNRYLYYYIEFKKINYKKLNMKLQYYINGFNLDHSQRNPRPLTGKISEKNAKNFFSNKILYKKAQVEKLFSFLDKLNKKGVEIYIYQLPYLDKKLVFKNQEIKEELLKRNYIKYISKDPYILNETEFFHDYSHLNKKGKSFFSNKFIEDIKNDINR